ncbi:hypothetical protein PT2222_10532 [Paraburkholderia tropica]
MGERGHDGSGGEPGAGKRETGETARILTGLPGGFPTRRTRLRQAPGSGAGRKPPAAKRRNAGQREVGHQEALPGRGAMIGGNAARPRAPPPDWP